MQTWLHVLIWLLVGILLLGALVLRLDRRDRRLRRQLEMVACTGPVQAETARPPQRVRRQSASEGRRRLLYVVFRYDGEAPRMWPLSRTIVLATAIGLADGMFAWRMGLPFWS